MRVGYMGNMESQNTRVWMEEMAARGVEPVAISEKEPSWDVEWAPLLIREPRIKGVGLGRLSIARELSALSRQRRLGILHNHHVDRFAFWARASGFHPRVITCWGGDVLLLDDRTRWHRAGVRMALRSADAITVGSEHLLGAAVRAGALPDRCTLVGWGVDVERFKRDTKVREQLRQEWDLEGRTVVLSTRRLHRLYRIDSVIRAFAHARSLEPSLALVVVGDGPECGDLQSLVRDMGILDDVRFTGGIWSDAWPSMPVVYSAADIFCSVPVSDGGPLSVLEAMATGLPVVATDLPVMREWLSSTGAGLLWAGDNESELASLILNAVREHREMGSRARAYVLEHHQRSVEFNRVRELYERLTHRE